MTADPPHSPFALAITSFIADIKRNEDVRTPFYREVLAQLSNGRLEDKTADQNRRCAEHLATFIQDLECNKRRTSKTLRVSDKLRPLVSGLNQYSKAFDVLIQATPDGAVLLYGGARLLLQLAQNFSNCFDTVLSIMEDIGHQLECYHLFSEAYQSSVGMQSLLVESYKNIITFWQKASKLLSRKAFKTLLIGIVKPLDAEWQKLRQDLTSDSDRVKMLAQATEADLRRQKILEKESKGQNKQRRQILDWIKAGEEDEKLDIRGEIRTNLELCHENTCEWLFDHPDMVKWLNAKKTTAIWYSAPPGAGKTILASTVARKLQEQGLKKVTFFYSFNDVVRRKPITALRCMAMQLLIHVSSVPEKVERLYQEDVTNHCFKLNDLRVAIQVVESLIKQVSRIHIIVDGLDECHDRNQLLFTFCALLDAKTYGIVKWFFASRPEHDIRMSMRKHGATEIQAPQESLLTDIRRYVEQFIERKIGEKCDTCTEHWAQKSEGNFLWAKLMMDIMEGNELTCDDEIEEELAKFPKGLTGCYLRSLAQISKRPERHQDLARRIFTMIVAAAQPLRLSELAHAVAASSSTEFSPKRLPRTGLIEELCSNLVLFDRNSKGTESDPLLKFAHKSIQDFFMQDPDSLDIPADLRKYFVSAPAAHLELGELCMAYLSYGRYQTSQITRENLRDEDHAFLQHAATFWHYYLSNAPHSQTLSEKVVSFIRTMAFWNCISVQSTIAPHLFARFREIFGSGFEIEATGPKKDGDDDYVSYANPLPQWLDEYSPSGPEIVDAFHCFVKEWHPVLNSHPTALNQCVMPQIWEERMPGRGVWVSERVKMFSLFQEKSWPASLSAAEVVAVEENGDGVLIELCAKLFSNGRCSLEFWQAQINRNSALPYSNRRPTKLPAIDLPLEAHVFEGDSTTNEEQYYVIDPMRLRVQKYDKAAKTSRIEMVSDTCLSESGAKSWTVLAKSMLGTRVGRAVAFNCTVNTSGSSGKDDAMSRHDSGYGSVASQGGSNYSGSDDDASYSEDESLDDEPIIRNCMLIIPTTCDPIWKFWTSTNSIEAMCAFHQSDQLAVWSPSTHKLCVADLSTGKVEETILPEPSDIRLSTVTALRKELHFVEGDGTLYYFLYTAKEKENSVLHSVSLSSFNFSTNAEGERIIERTHPTQTVHYECCGSIQHPLVLTSWSSDYLYIVMPASSCDPKMIRIKYPRGDYSDQSSTGGVSTLKEPIYLPYSTPYRNPSIKLLPQQDGTDTLTLALDAEVSHSSRPGHTMKSNPVVQQPAMIMTWSIHSDMDWRDWNPDVDGRSVELKNGVQKCDMLRGTFVDAEKRFTVPIRSGLDWRKKAFLSCG